LGILFQALDKIDDIPDFAIRKVVPERRHFFIAVLYLPVKIAVGMVSQSFYQIGRPYLKLSLGS